MSDFERPNEAMPELLSLETVGADPTGQAEAETPETWLERLKGIDYRDHRTAIAVVGAAAVVAVGVGAYALSKKHGGGRFFVEYADRRAQEQGVISIGESAEHGAAVSLPVGDAALQRLDAQKGSGLATKALFAMTGRRPNGEAGDFAYPLTGDPEQVRQHGETTRRAASWLIDHLSRRTDSEPNN